jgi:hypothetical protein
MSAAMAFNHGRIMRSLTGAGKPRHADVLAQRALIIYFATVKRLRSLQAFVRVYEKHFNRVTGIEVTTAA